MFSRPFTDEEMQVILDEIRAGSEVSIGGMRSRTRYLFREGQFRRDEFDEGHIEENTCSEAQFRSLVAIYFSEFLPLLRHPLRRQMVEALGRGDRRAARQLLSALLAYGQSPGDIAQFDAILAWPEVPPTDEALEGLRSTVISQTAYHLVMGLMVDWQPTPSRGCLGVEVLTTLEAMLGPTPRLYSQRADFREMAGDLAGAMADVTTELSLTPPDDPGRPSLETRLVALRDRLTADP